MAVKIGTPRSQEDKAKIGLLAVCGADYGVSGYVEDLGYYQGEDSIRKAEILAQHMNTETGEALMRLVRESNAKMEEISHGGYRQGAGRKKESPPDAKRRTFTVTDEEHTEIEKLIEQLRQPSE